MTLFRSVSVPEFPQWYSDIVSLFRSVSVPEFPQWYSDIVSLFRSVSVPEFPQWYSDIVEYGQYMVTDIDSMLLSPKQSNEPC